MYCLECVLYAKIALSKPDEADMRRAYEKRKAKTSELFGLHWEDDSCNRCGNSKVKATRAFVGL